jgi:hypothetical protein
VLGCRRSRERRLLRKRLRLTRSLEGVVRDVREPEGLHLPGASPLNRVGVRPYRAELERLAERLGDLERPVTAFGLELVDRFLTDGGSPLYDRSSVDSLPQMVESIRSALEPR